MSDQCDYSLLDFFLQTQAANPTQAARDKAGYIRDGAFSRLTMPAWKEQGSSQRSWGKVIFSQASVILSTRGGGGAIPAYIAGGIPACILLECILVYWYFHDVIVF